MRCPRCGTTDNTEQVDDSRWFCDNPGCRFVFTPQPPSVEPCKRRDVDE